MSKVPKPQRPKKDPWMSWGTQVYPTLDRLQNPPRDPKRNKAVKKKEKTMSIHDML